MRKYISLMGIITILCGLFLSTCTTTGKKKDLQKLEVVPWVDLNRYAGTWYEIARYPNRFQKDCYATSVTYTIQKDGTVEVINTCRSGSVNGKEKSIRGKAWSVDPQTQAKLKVQFFWPFRGDYWVIQLDENYQYAVVGHPKRTYLWILSRTPSLDEQTYAAILGRLQEQGYDTSKLLRTQHPEVR